MVKNHISTVPGDSPSDQRGPLLKNNFTIQGLSSLTRAEIPPRPAGSGVYQKDWGPNQSILICISNFEIFSHLSKIEIPNFKTPKLELPI